MVKHTQAPLQLFLHNMTLVLCRGGIAASFLWLADSAYLQKEFHGASQANFLGQFLKVLMHFQFQAAYLMRDCACFKNYVFCSTLRYTESDKF